MNNYSSKNSAAFSKAKLPKKSKRQKALLRSVKSGQLGYSDAVDCARLIPKSVVAEFKVVSWPDE